MIFRKIVIVIVKKKTSMHIFCGFCVNWTVLVAKTQQKKAARILLNVRDILTPTSFLFSCLSWMPIKDYFMFRQVIFLYKVLYNQMPAYLSVFRYTRDVNCLQTRSNDFMSNLLYLPRPKTENYRRSYSFLWNKLSQNIRNSTSVSNYKSVYLREYFHRANI